MDENMHGYFNRTLSIYDDQMEIRSVPEIELLNQRLPSILLGEPGMGKTELMKYLASQLDCEAVSAIRFMNSKDPEKFLKLDKPLVIDGLDEAMAQREGDAVDAILAQIEAISCPSFILSCRSREWEGRTKQNLTQLYGAEPNIYTLNQFSRTDAAKFLQLRHPKADPEKILSHLDNVSLSDLYSNPLMLTLMGKVAEQDNDLPQSKGALFDRVSEIIWPEHDEHRTATPLSSLNTDQAISAAGAICSALLLGGKDSVFFGSAAYSEPDDLLAWDTKLLPGGTHVKTVLGSKLFRSVGPNRAQPIHRVVAEFLAARWLARNANTPRVRRRLLNGVSIGGKIPSSLRGVFAWIAYHSADMAPDVIQTDPYGILRYGDTDALTPALAEALFSALGDLAKNDPYFRANDWDRRTVSSLMIPSLKIPIQQIISSKESNSHLRFLMIEGMRDTALANDLANDLAAIIKSTEFYYREREDAVEALLPLKDTVFWRSMIDHLTWLADEDSTRLAKRVVKRVGCNEFSNLMLTEIIFSECGLLLSPLPKNKKSRTSTLRRYAHIADEIHSDRIKPFLDLLTDYINSLIPSHDWESQNAILELAGSLIVRGLKEGRVTEVDVVNLWCWLKTFKSAYHFHRDVLRELASLIDNKDKLRRSVQKYALAHVRKAGQSLWDFDYDMQRRLVGIGGRKKDVVYWLDDISKKSNDSQKIQDDWGDLVRFGRMNNEISQDVESVALKFIRGNSELLHRFEKLKNPGKRPWEIKEEKRKAKSDRKHKANQAAQRQRYALDRPGLRNGALDCVLNPAQAYLGQYSDIDRDLSPRQRLTSWLGEDLCKDSIAGFEATIWRDDLPTFDQLAESAAKGKFYYVQYPLMAGIAERCRTDRGLDDIPLEICQIAFLIAQRDFVFRDEDKDASEIYEMLQNRVFAEENGQLEFAKHWMEPFLEAGATHVPGLYKLSNDEDWVVVGRKLAEDWLRKFDSLPLGVEMELVDILLRACKRSFVARIARQRSKNTFRDIEHLFSWLAIDVIVRLDEVLPYLNKIGNQNPEFIFYLGSRLFGERHNQMLPTSPMQLEWIFAQFRQAWPELESNERIYEHGSPKETNDILRATLTHIADDTSDEAIQSLDRLLTVPNDTYTDLVLHEVAAQKQKRAEKLFEPISAQSLGKILADGPPSTVNELMNIVLEELDIAQAKLIGSDIDHVKDFWTDDNIPRGENRCRDRLTALIEPELARYSISRITEADMPQDKRADLAFGLKQMQLPMEVKGQWHSDVWDAATGQLDQQYLIDWRCEQSGIYCVLWFGTLPSKSNRRLKVHPDDLPAPKTPEEMKMMLIDRISENRRPMIKVVVLDFLSGLKQK